MGVGLVYIVLEVVLSIASDRDFSNSRGRLNFLDSSGFLSGNRLLFLLTIAFFLKVAFLTVVIVGDVCFVPSTSFLACSLRLGSVDVH